MESVGKQTIVQLEKTGLEIYDHEGKALEITSDVDLEPIALLADGDASVLNLDNEVLHLSELLQVEISSVAFSPKKTYLVACSKYVEGQSNLFILNSSKEILASFVWKSSSKDGCRNVSWTNDEKYMARRESTSAKSLYIYEVENSLSEELGVVSQDKITSFAFAPHSGDEEKPYFLLVGASGEPSSLTRFYQMPLVDKEKFKSLSKGGQEMDFIFAPNGHAVIIWTQHVVDNTGQSYYGKHDLRYVQLGGGNKRSKVAVFDNQVSDVAWSPDSEDFIVISGKQPAVCTLYTKNCIPAFEFGRIHMNTIRYSPFSNLVLLGGFGNLVGNIQIWNKDTLTLIGKNKAHCTVVCEWSPDGAQILTAVTHPRVRVDNEVKQFTYYGKKLYHRKIDNTNALYQATWQPHDISNFKKIEIPEGFKCYDPEKDPDEITDKPKTSAKKGTLILPKSSAFGNMMRAEMNAATLTGPRKLKKDDYKEYLIETAEEKKELTAKPAPKPKAAPKNSWRSTGGFKIPTKEEQKEETEKFEEEKKLIPAPTEYRIPAPTQNKQNNQNQSSQGNGNNKNKKGNKNKNKKSKGKGPAQANGGNGQTPHGQQNYNQQYDQYNQYYGGQQEGYELSLIHI